MENLTDYPRSDIFALRVDTLQLKADPFQRIGSPGPGIEMRPVLYFVTFLWKKFTDREVNGPLDVLRLFDLDDFSTLVIPAILTNVMWKTGFTTIRTLDKISRFQCMM